MLHFFEGVIPNKYKARDGTEKTTWDKAGFKMWYDDERDRYWGRFHWWPEGMKMLLQPPRENTNQRGASNRGDPSPDVRPLITEEEDDQLPF